MRKDAVLEQIIFGYYRIKSGWTQHASARDASGESCGAYERQAVSFCAAGAMRRSHLGSEASWAARRAIENEVPEYPDIVCFNDAFGREKSQVLAVFMKAILRLDPKWKPVKKPTKKATTPAKRRQSRSV